MTIDEAIENLKYDIEIDMYICDIAPQIAEWLEELKEYKKNSNTCPICDTYCSYLAEEFENGYNKAIDDCKELTFREVVYCDSLNDRTEFRELAEQLKEKESVRFDKLGFSNKADELLS